LNGVESLGKVDVAPSAHVEMDNLLGTGTRVRAGVRLDGEVRTGENVLIDTNSNISGPVSIGSDTYIGPNCVIGHPDATELDHLLTANEIRSKSLTSIGRGCVIRSGSIIYSNVKIGDHVAFGHNVMVREDVTIGNKTKIGTNSVVDGKSKIGSSVSVQTGVYVCTFSTVEDAVFLGPCCVFTNDKYVTQKMFELIGPTVKKGASIGANALLFPGIVVGEGAVVGSQAMVNKDIPARTIFAGIPARKIRGVPKDWQSSLLRTLKNG
jgi:acetyltransferase-like isoleucine patch superfamily enzyme